jgi:hypothetical protein
VPEITHLHLPPFLCFLLYPVKNETSKTIGLSEHGYQTVIFSAFTDYRNIEDGTGEFEKLSDYRLLDQVLILLYYITDIGLTKIIGCPALTKINIYKILPVYNIVCRKTFVPRMLSIRRIIVPFQIKTE